MPTIEVWSDTKGKARCRDERCRALITWAEVVKSKKKMCFTGDPVALRTRHDPETHRLIEEIDAADNHWAACPGAKDFRRR